MWEAYTVMREAEARRGPAAQRGAWRPVAAALLAVGLGLAGLGILPARDPVVHATLGLGGGEPAAEGDGLPAAAVAPAVAGTPAAAGDRAAAAAPAVVRFHVVPHSDAALDQQVKLRVRDRLLGEMEAIAAGYGNWWAVPWGRYVHRLASEAEAELAAAGVAYGARVTWGVEPLSPRHRAELDLPGAEHPTLRVILGDGRGSNWWCVLFPPLCFMDASQLAFAVAGTARAALEGHGEGIGGSGAAVSGDVNGADVSGTSDAEKAVWRLGLRLWPFLDGGEEADALWSWDALRE